MRSRRGSQVVEFVLLFPVLLAFVAGIIDVGWYISVDVALTDAVRSGAWRGARTLQANGPSMAAIEAAGATWVAGSHGSENLPTFTAELVGGPPLQVVRVVGRRPVDPLIGLLPVFSDHEVELLVRMMEQPPE